MAASDITDTSGSGYPYVERKMRVIEWDWLCDASGDYSQQTATTVTGLISRATYKPDAAGTQPTDNYDVTLLDENSGDALSGDGANQSNTLTGNLAGGFGYAVNSKLTLTVANAGNAKGGVFTIYVI